VTGSARPDGVVVNLAVHRNNVGCHARPQIAAEGFDGFGRAFPAAGLTEAASLLGLPAEWGNGAPDNVVCEGQVIELGSAESVATVYVVGACSGGSAREVLRLSLSAEVVAEVQVELGDFLHREPMAGNTLFAAAEFLYDIGGRTERRARPRLWTFAAPLPAPVRCDRLSLPNNPDVHIFGLWLSTADGRTDAGSLQPVTRHGRTRN